MDQNATAFYRSLLAHEPDLASVRADLAQELLAEDDLEGAIAEATEALARDPSLVQAWLTRGTARKALHRYKMAARDFKNAVALMPNRAMILINLSNTMAELEELADAEHWLRRAIALDPNSAEAQASLGSVLVRQGNLAAAEAPCLAALALDPSLIGPHQNLSAILARDNPVEARAHRDAAYSRQQVFVEPAHRAERTVLVLSAADIGNVPLRHLFPRERVTLMHWYVEYATPDQDFSLPPFDLVFNAIGDPDFFPATLPPSVLRLLEERGETIVNHPAKIARTGRSALPALLAGIEGVVVPPVIRCEGVGLESAVAAAGIEAPFIVRPIGSHSGIGVEKIDDAEDLAAFAETPCHVTQFIDYASADGWHRKYRAIFVEGKPYPYHLAIARDWLVHHWTAGMEYNAAHRDEERDFLADPASALGPAAMTALESIGARLGLDYAGIDFSMLPDGRLLVFEANATMLVHPEEGEVFAYRNPAVREIQAAFDGMVGRRTGR